LLARDSTFTAKYGISLVDISFDGGLLNDYNKEAYPALSELFNTSTHVN
jgi:hypothetical protein